MKSSLILSRGVYLLLIGLIVSLSFGCKTWRIFKRTPAQARNYENATPHQPNAQVPDAMMPVSGMGYQVETGIMVEGPSMISESAPLDEPTRKQIERQLQAEKRRTFRDEFAGGTNPANQAPGEAPSQSDGPDYSQLPYAIPVQGQPGFVRLPGSDSGLPIVDVRGIASGTPVEIPHPLQVGKSIQFRIP